MRMKRKEVVGLIRELVAEQLIQPSLILIEQSSPDDYKLQIKGDYSLEQIEMFVKDRFSLEKIDDRLILSTR